MGKLEQKIIKFIHEHMEIFVFLAITILGAVVRYCLRSYISGDMSRCLIPWYEKIKSLGVHSLSRQIGNYNIFYQFLIVIMTYLPVNPMVGYKVLSILFDYLLAGVVAILVYRLTNQSKSKAILAYACILMSPLVFLNSACWGQCDGIYVTFLMLAVLALFKEKYNWMMVTFGIAFVFKLQAVFLLPFFLFIYFVKQKFSILKFLIIPLCMVLAGLPGIIAGRNVFDVFRIYLDQTSTYSKIQMNYPSAWCILVNSALKGDEVFYSVKYVAIFMTICILLLLYYYWIRKRVQMTECNMLYIAFLTCYTCVLFLPTMHERYGYIYEVLAILIAFIHKKSRVLLAGLLSISIIIYGNYLFGLGQPINQLFGFVNLSIYLAYLFLLNKNMINALEVQQEA